MTYLIYNLFLKGLVCTWCFIIWHLNSNYESWIDNLCNLQWLAWLDNSWIDPMAISECRFGSALNRATNCLRLSENGNGFLKLELATTSMEGVCIIIPYLEASKPHISRMTGIKKQIVFWEALDLLSLETEFAWVSNIHIIPCIFQWAQH